MQSVKAGDICGLTSMAGTSMATPIVAGAAAVVREYFFKGYYPSGDIILFSSSTRVILKHTCIIRRYG